MHFDCCFRDPQVTGNLFVQLAGDDMLEHFPLARRELATRTSVATKGLSVFRRAPSLVNFESWLALL
jgi:hypothetical protein